MKKRIPFILILILILGAGIYAKTRFAQEDGNSRATGVKIYGTVAIRDLSLAFTEQERISAILVEEGEAVSAGQLLAQLRSDKIETAITEARARIGAEAATLKRLKAGNRPQEIDQVRAEVEAVQAQVTNSRQRIDRLVQTGGTTSKQDLDDARAQLRVVNAQLKARQLALNLMIEGPRQEDIEAAQQRIAALQANLDSLNIRLADMTLTAPATGIIQSRILEPGEIAGPQRPVLIMALNDPKWVRAYVSEQDLGRIELGQRAQVLSDSFPDEPVAGWVGFISPVAEFTPRAVQTEELRSKLVYRVRILVQDSENRLRLGMPVSVLIDEQQTLEQSNSGQGV
jgi:HlyD family secretion protein